MPTTIDTSSTAEQAFERLLKKHVQTFSLADVPTLREAFSIASDLYQDQMHWTGVSIIEHCLGVLEEFIAYQPDDEGFIACLFHHALDTHAWTLDDIEQKYGSAVRSIVSGVHLLGHVGMSKRRMSIGNMRLMFLRVSDDIRVVVLILCDHLHKLQRLHGMPPERRKDICRDVLQLYGPVAARLGMYSMKNELERRAFPVMYPTDAARISEQLAKMRKKHGTFLEDTADFLRDFLAREGVKAAVTLREKKPYSIFRKMNSKSVTHIDDIYDLFAVRVIVPTDTACYQTLGLLHRLGHPVANRFKDYISFPKPNGYQSLHTTLARLPGAPEDVFVEVQIRTEAMQREADLGLAAHWSYKEGARTGQAARRAELQKALSAESLEETNAHVSDYIFVLTPKGDIIELPEGATPLDFAFHVHTDVGLTFRSARVNGSISPLNYQLENGDIVEIVRNNEPHPSPNWMNVLRTSSARSSLRRYIQMQDKPTYVQRGKELLSKELVRRGMSPLDPDLSLLRVIDGEKYGQSAREDFLMKIGQGVCTPFSVFPRVEALKHLRTAEEKKVHVAPSATDSLTIRIDGNIPMPHRFARCCKADEQKGSSIQGVIGRDGVVRIHHAACKLLRNGNPERRIHVSWQ